MGLGGRDRSLPVSPPDPKNIGLLRVLAAFPCTISPILRFREVKLIRARDAADDAGWPISAIAAAAETSLRTVRAAIDAGVLGVQSYAPTRISADRAARFITAARATQMDRVRLVAADLIGAGFLRPYPVADLFGLAENVVLNAVQRGRLPAVGRSIWLFIDPQSCPTIRKHCRHHTTAIARRGERHVLDRRWDRALADLALTPRRCSRPGCEGRDATTPG
jgi:hypothetical protein